MLVFITCVILLYFGQVNLTFFIAMTYYVYRFMWLSENINGFTQTYQKLYVSLTRVNEIMENRLYQDEQFGEKSLKNINGVIEFKNVTFHYPDEENVLKDFNLKLEPNKKLQLLVRVDKGNLLCLIY